MAQKSRAEVRQGVHSRIRKKVQGTAERPRLAVFRSLNHIYDQAQKAGITSVVFDRGGYVYHGRVKALIDATREAGLNKHEEAVKESEEKSNDDK